MIAPRLLPALSLLFLAGSAGADTQNLVASQDNTMFGESAVSSNGAGNYFFAGRTAFGGIRRGLIAFDVASAIPAGSTITAVDLELNMSITIAGPTPVALHRATASWGEGTSIAPNGEGVGTAATPGDATWTFRFFNTLSWTTAGGDFVAGASASTVVDQAGTYVWSSPGMVADVQAWLDAPSSNAGWVVIGDESAFPTAKRFDSRTSAGVAGLPPVLVVQYTPPGGPATSFCVPAQSGTLACPCANPSPFTDRGCENSAGTGGAQATASGSASLAADTLQFQTAGELPSSLSIVLQGNNSNPAGLVFGEGVRCVTGTLKRLRTENAVGGGIVYPSTGETAVAAMSALLGDTISPGSTRHYQVYYRDPGLPCAGEPNFNVTQALSVLWNP